MRLLPLILLAYLTLALHVALGGMLNIGRASPNLVLPVAVFIGIYARRHEALLGCLFLGLAQDLFSQRPLGLYAFSYAMAGLAILSARPSVHRGHPLTHFFMTLLAALLVAAIVVLNDWLYPILHRTAALTPPSPIAGFLSSLYTACISVVMLFLLSQMRGVFGFKSVRRFEGRPVPNP